MGRKMTADAIMKQVRALEDRANVSAFIILDASGKHIGTVRIFPGARLRAAVADWTVEMPENVDFSKWTRWQYGWANGGGYDKASAAMDGMHIGAVTLDDNGRGWQNQLLAHDYQVIQAV